MKLSPFNPIYFHDESVKSGPMTDYIHYFAPNDSIIIEVLHKADEQPDNLSLIDSMTAETIMELNWHRFAINETECVSFYELKGLDPGYYQLEFGQMMSSLIIITDEEEILNNTVLVQYANSTNDLRFDVYPKINGRLRYFETRLFGGFRDDGWEFGVDNEQFTTDKGDIVELQAIETTDKTLTIGTSEGSPTWVGSLINHILACKLIFIDGERYSYAGSNGVESFSVEPDEQTFIYSVKLRKAEEINTVLEKAIRTIFRKTPTNLRRVGNKLRKI